MKLAALDTMICNVRDCGAAGQILLSSDLWVGQGEVAMSHGGAL